MVKRLYDGYLSHKNIRSMSNWIGVFYLACFVNVLLTSSTSVFGNIVFLLMVYITFRGGLIYCLPVVLIINDGLGTAIMGQLSFYWVALALIILDLLITRWKNQLAAVKQSMLFFFVGILYSLHTLVFQYDMELRTPLNILVFIVMLVYIYNKIEIKSVDLKIIIDLLGVSCVIVALHMVITGGINYTTYSYEEALQWSRTSRYGIIGVGVGDPNFSGLRLIFGFVTVLHTKWPKWIKFVCAAIFLYCIVKTVSITAIIVLIIITSLIIILQANPSKVIKALFLLLIAASIGFIILSTVPLGSVSEQVELFKYRIEATLKAVIENNYDSASSNRSSHFVEYMNYLSDTSRSPLNILFGCEHIPPADFDSFSHNTFIDWLVRFGYVGFILLMIVSIRKLGTHYRVWKKAPSETNKYLLLIKVLYFIYSFTLSIYNGADVALHLMIMLII